MSGRRLAEGVWVLAVADGYGQAGGADLDAGSAVVPAVLLVRQATPVTATFLIRSRDATHDSAYARSLSKRSAP